MATEIMREDAEAFEILDDERQGALYVYQTPKRSYESITNATWAPRKAKAPGYSSLWKDVVAKPVHEKIIASVSTLTPTEATHVFRGSALHVDSDVDVSLDFDGEGAGIKEASYDADGDFPPLDPVTQIPCKKTFEVGSINASNAELEDFPPPLKLPECVKVEPLYAAETSMWKRAEKEVEEHTSGWKIALADHARDLVQKWCAESGDTDEDIMSEDPVNVTDMQACSLTSKMVYRYLDIDADAA